MVNGEPSIERSNIFTFSRCVATSVGVKVILQGGGADVGLDYGGAGEDDGGGVGMVMMAMIVKVIL